MMDDRLAAAADTRSVEELIAAGESCSIWFSRRYLSVRSPLSLDGLDLHVACLRRACSACKILGRRPLRPRQDPRTSPNAICHHAGHIEDKERDTIMVRTAAAPPAVLLSTILPPSRLVDPGRRISLHETISLIETSSPKRLALDCIYDRRQGCASFSRRGPR